MLDTLETLVRSTLDYAPSLILTATGAALSERSGVINLSLEGMMRVGAFAGAAVALATGSPWIGVLSAAAAGVLVAVILGSLCVSWGADQVVTGIALNLVALAGVTFILEALYGSADSPAVTRLPEISIPIVRSIPILRAFSGHSALTYLALVLPAAGEYALRRSVWGLRIRAVGENPRAVATVGLSVKRLRYQGVLISGALAGMGGACLSLSVLDHFNDLMPYGQGFIALAAMVFGKWSPLGAAGAAAFFALGDAVRVGAVSSGLHLPGGILMALPYALSLLLLAGVVGRARAPAADGVHFDPESR